jgi:hypothetical protein
MFEVVVDEDTDDNVSEEIEGVPNVTLTLDASGGNEIGSSGVKRDEDKDVDEDEDEDGDRDKRVDND